MFTFKFQTYKRPAIALALTVLLGTAACGNPEGANQAARTAEPVPQESGAGSTAYREKSARTDETGATWIPLGPAAASLGYRLKDDSTSGGFVKMGFSDVMYMLKPGDKEVFSLGERFDLPEAPKIMDGEIYVTPHSLSKLLQTEVGWNPNTGEIAVQPPSEASTEPGADADGPPLAPRRTAQQGGLRIQSAGADTDQLLSYARQFLGVPYEFGAAPYEESKRFDCSSFTRHVFKKFGVNLPRLAKDQDNVGSRVRRNDLEKGDLIFFTVPGRFESDAIPGHVGIYMGNGKFIHTWGDPGVQISDLDSGYWSNVILHYQRVL